MTKEEKEAKAKEKLQKERARLYGMSEYERKYSECEYICGVDEVGRGPFAGPVMAGAVILPKDCEILYLNDSRSFRLRGERRFTPRYARRQCLIMSQGWSRRG